jgi:membrane fusion protein, multidrug efflux system
VKRLLVILVSILAIPGVGLWFAQVDLGASSGTRQGRRAAGEEPVPVLVAAARYADVPVTLDAVGTVQALATVTVRPQVDGRLLELKFHEGQDVRQGDVLARIDPTTYQAVLDQAVAKKAQDEAQLANARLDLARYSDLATRSFASRQQLDTQQATVNQLAAQIEGDQAQINNARAYLDYTTIAAPLDGRTGIRMVDEGNLVRAGDPAIVVITKIMPIAVLFNLPQQHLRRVNAAIAKGQLAVEALDADNRTVIDRGTLDVVDNQVDQATGTVRMKALFPNAERQLWPGQFVNVRLYVGTVQHAVVIPTAAVQRGPDGAYVYTVGVDGKAAQRPVTVTQQDEHEALVAAGLTPPEETITSGFTRLTDGTAVRVMAAGPEPESVKPVIGTERGREPTSQRGPGPPEPSGERHGRHAQGRNLPQ